MSPRTNRARRSACTCGRSPILIFSLRKGWVISDFFFVYQADRNFFSPPSVNNMEIGLRLSDSE